MPAQIDKKYAKTRPCKLYSRLLSYAFFEGRPLTTKGRWINPLVFKLYALQKKLPQLKKVESPIFIIGTGRSGTTILGVTLSMHKEVGFLNEPKALWNSIYSKEDLIGSYSRGEAYYFLGKDDVTPKIKKQIHKIYGAYLLVSGSKRVVDKYPELIFRLPFLLEIFPDAKCLFLVRNGWDTISSINHWSERLGIQKADETRDWWGANNRKWHLLKEQVLKKDPYFEPIKPYLDELHSHLDFSALEWIATMREGVNAEKKYPNHIFRVNFESLAEHPTEVMSKIINFTGLKQDDTFMRYSQEVLRPVNPKEKSKIHPTIISLMEETMQQLGY